MSEWTNRRNSSGRSKFIPSRFANDHRLERSFRRTLCNSQERRKVYLARVFICRVRGRELLQKANWKWWWFLKTVKFCKCSALLLFLEASRRYVSSRSSHQTHIVKSRSSIMACNGNVLLIFMRHEISNLRLKACKCRKPLHALETLSSSPFFAGMFSDLIMQEKRDEMRGVDALILDFNRQQN